MVNRCGKCANWTYDAYDSSARRAEVEGLRSCSARTGSAEERAKLYPAGCIACQLFQKIKKVVKNESK